MNKTKRHKDQVDMDLINSWLVQLHSRIEEEVALTEEDQEYLEAIVYGNISDYLERLFNYPGYNNYN